MIFLGKHAGNPNKRVVGLICFCWLEDSHPFLKQLVFQRGGLCDRQVMAKIVHIFEVAVPTSRRSNNEVGWSWDHGLQWGGTTKN